MNLDLSKINKIFFIGIGGIGISALAKMAISKGIDVSGVNDEEGRTIDSLRVEGAAVFFQKDLKDVLVADMYVYSDAWLYRGPEIIENARKTGKPVMNYFEALGQFAKEFKVIAIAGTHGKTTTTAMVAEILIEAGIDPTVIVGSFVEKFGSNFRKGNSGPRYSGASYLVVEADEYNRHFLSLDPFITVVTNVEADHLDCYKDLADIQETFEKLIQKTKGSVVYNSKDINSAILIQKYNGKLVDYADFLDKVPKLLVPGIHNRMDAAAALAVADILGIKEEDAQTSIAHFSGTWRRLEKKGKTAEGTIIYDDYAHHPTEIRASLQALRELYPKSGDNKITVLFQPHLYSRTKALFNDFVNCFGDADRVLLLPIYFAREDKDESVSSEKLAEAIVSKGANVGVQAFSSFELAEKLVKSLSFGQKDIFVTMGAGEAYKIADIVFKITPLKR